MKYRLLPLVFMAAASQGSFAAAYANVDGLNIGTSNTVADGSKSIAAGEENQASASSLTVGKSIHAENWSAAIGGYHWIIGGSSNATIGTGNLLDTSLYSTAIGNGNDMYLSSSTTIVGGEHAVTAEIFSFAAGYGNSFSAPSGVSQYMGDSNIILGKYNSIVKSDVVEASIIMGRGNLATASHSWILGMGNNGQADTVTLGTYSNQVSGASLIVGTGASGESRSNGLVVLRNGTVSIPSGILQLGSETAVKPSWLTSNSYLQKSQGMGASAAPSALLAIGTNASATGDSSIALGWGASASTGNAVAIGNNSSAGSYATAAGSGTIATGSASAAFGYNTKSLSYGSTAIGIWNLGIAGSATNWIESDSVLEVGNGADSTHRSNAITTLKNGQTTLINKAWKAANPSATPTSTTALADPGTTSDADSKGEALVVDGHTRLRGKVVIEQAQGDISMGIYGSN